MEKSNQFRTISCYLNLTLNHNEIQPFSLLTFYQRHFLRNVAHSH